MPSIPPANPALAGPVVLAAVVIPPPPNAPADQGVPATTVIKPAPVVPAVRVVRTTGVMPPAPGKPVVPAGAVTLRQVAPPKRVSRRGSTKRLPGGRSHWESAPIEELVAYACSQPVILRDLKVPGMTEHLLRLALERLCQRLERYGLIPCQDRWELISVLRTILSDL